MLRLRVVADAVSAAYIDFHAPVWWLLITCLDTGKHVQLVACIWPNMMKHVQSVACIWLNVTKYVEPVACRPHLEGYEQAMSVAQLKSHKCT